MDYPASPPPMKVLHIISGDLWAGAEVQAYTLLSCLKSYCQLKVVLMNEGELANKLRKIDIAVDVLDEKVFSSLKIFSLLRGLIKEFNPDVIHTHRLKENLLGSLANATTIRKRCIRTVHGAPEFTAGWKTKFKRKVDILIGRYLQDKIIAVSDELHSKLKKHYREEKILTVYNGVDHIELSKNLKFLEFKTSSPNKIHIGIIGRLVSVKRVDIFLAIASEFLKEDLTNFHFHIIGDGPLKNELQIKADELGLNQTITFHGHRSDISSCIYSLDAVVMCSDHEGLPMVALETIALKKPFITSINSLSRQLGLANARQDENVQTYLFKMIKNIDSFDTNYSFNTDAEIRAQEIFSLYHSIQAQS